MKTILHSYYFNVDNPDERLEWEALSEKLKARKGPRCHEAWSGNDSDFYRKHIEPLNGKEIELETKHLFDNQWNTAPTETSDSGLRVFDWALVVYPNKLIKRGHYLDITPEMEEIRRNTVACGYCGKQYQAAQGYVFCDACLDSEFLDESDLHLTRLHPISKTGNRAKLTGPEKANLLPLFVKRQTTGKDSRNAKKLRKQREKIKTDYEKTIDTATTERDAFLWLMDNDVSIDNVIFYSHTGRFCFGWRSPLGPAIVSKLLDILCEFPFDYDIKKTEQ